MDSYKHKFPDKYRALQVATRRGKAGSIYRKGSYWLVTSCKRKKKIKTFIIFEGFRNEVL